MALSDDVTQDKRWIAIPGLDDGVRSALSVPLVSGDMLVGALSLYSDQAGFFDEDSRRLVESATAALAAAIANARLYQQEREQFRRLQQSQAQLIHAEKMAALGRLTASIAHEINNPLQAVLGCLALIHDDLADPDLDESQRRAHTQHDLQVAEVEIKRIADIVRRLREFYQPAHEDLRATHLQSILEDLLVLVRKQLQDSGISVELVWGQLPELYTNPDLLKQVFLNLVLNAIDAMPGGGTLHVRTALEQATLRNSPQPTPVARVEFSDTGAGIPPKLLSRVFEPFFTTKEHGSGLGLSISYEIVASLGGEIAVTSEVGKGTTFAVLVPMREMQGAQRQDH
jgi:two-component system NtrC family sensor kinase